MSQHLQDLMLVSLCMNPFNLVGCHFTILVLPGVKAARLEASFETLAFASILDFLYVLMSPLFFFKGSTIWLMFLFASPQRKLLVLSQ